MTGPLYGDCQHCGANVRLTTRGRCFSHRRVLGSERCEGTGRRPIRTVQPARIWGVATVHLPDSEVTP